MTAADVNVRAREDDVRAGEVVDSAGFNAHVRCKRCQRRQRGVEDAACGGFVGDLSFEPGIGGRPRGGFCCDCSVEGRLCDPSTRQSLNTAVQCRICRPPRAGFARQRSLELRDRLESLFELRLEGSYAARHALRLGLDTTDQHKVAQKYTKHASALQTHTTLLILEGA